MNGDVIKSFLVGLGFGVDDASLAKFNKAISSATLKVTALYASTEVAASGIVYGISKISESFEQLGYEYRLITPAINKAIILKRELFKAYAAAGINLQKTVLAAYRLNLSLTKTKFAFDAIYKSVGSRFFSLLTKQSDLFREKIYQNMPKIQATLESLVRFIFKALDATTQLGIRLWSILTRVYDFFVRLDKATDGWSTKILGAIAIWKLLNLSFLATPLGILFSLGLALLTLYDDFKTFQEGGKTLIDWGSDTTKLVVGLVTILGGLEVAFLAVSAAMKTWAVLSGIIAALKDLNLVLAITDALALVLEAPFWLIAAGIAAVTAALTAADAKWQIFGGHLSGFVTGIGSSVLNWLGGLGGANLAPNIGATGGVPTAPPTGGNTAYNNQSNQNVNQQTNITIQGIADAQAAASASSSEQQKLNFDLVRNLRSNLR